MPTINFKKLPEKKQEAKMTSIFSNGYETKQQRLSIHNQLLDIKQSKPG